VHGSTPVSPPARSGSPGIRLDPKRGIFFGARGGAILADRREKISSWQARGFVAASSAERVEGEKPRQWNVIVEFPSLEKAKTWYNSDEYQAAIPMRTDSAPGANIIFVEGL
jgi:uncharacterized protein (DUF1330 family)